jgi:hypothetical protein
MRDEDWFKPHPDRPAALPRQPKPGEEVWRLGDSDTGRVQTCELRDNSRAGAGWEVQILEAGEILLATVRQRRRGPVCRGSLPPEPRERVGTRFRKAALSDSYRNVHHA